MYNKYMYRSRISEKKFREIVKLFSLDVEASKTARITGLSRVSVNKIFDKLRERLARQCEADSPLGRGSIELDESYFGATRVRGTRGRGAQGKIPVFGMLKRSGKVYTQIVENCSAREILTIIERQAHRRSVLYSDGFKTYDGLADFGYKKHYRIQHGQDQFAQGAKHINGIENFWGLCKVRLMRFRGIHKHKFYYHLKECEFRYNHRHENMYLYLLKLLKNVPLKLS